MGNCMGQRKLGRSGKENAPKTPKKEEKGKTEVKEASKKGKLDENGRAGKEPEKVDAEKKVQEDNGNKNKVNIEEKTANDEVKEKEELLKSWVVFDESDVSKQDTTKMETTLVKAKAGASDEKGKADQKLPSQDVKQEEKAKKESNVEQTKQTNQRESHFVAGVKKVDGSESSKVSEKLSVKTEMKKEPSAKTEAKKEPSIKIEAKMEPSIKIEAKKEPSIKIEAKKEPNVKTEAKKEPSIKIEAKKEPSIKIEVKKESNVKTEVKKEQNVKIEVKKEPIIKIEVKKGEKDEGERLSYADAVKVKTCDTGKPDDKREHPGTGEPESIKILHEVKDGRIVATQKAGVMKQITEGVKEESEKEKKEKRIEILKKKMESYRIIKKSKDYLIDIEKMMFVDTVWNRKVILEDLIISGREIAGLVAVGNKDSSSKVSIRLTTDSWKTKMEEDTIPYTVEKGDDTLYRRFFFAFFVPFAKSVEFAVKCTGSSGTIWDNRNSKNYQVENVKEKEGPGILIKKFPLPKQALFADYVKRKSVCLMRASLENGKAKLTIATDKRLNKLPSVRYTTNNWKSFDDITCTKVEVAHGVGASVLEVPAPKDAKLMFAVFLKLDDREIWDSNNGKNYGIQG